MKPPIIYLPSGGGKVGIVPRNRHQHDVLKKIAAGEVVTEEDRKPQQQPASPNPEPPPKNANAKSKQRKPAADSWTSIRKTLRQWDQLQLLGLLHDLFKTVPEARAAIVGRLLLDEPVAAKRKTLDELCARVRRAVRPRTGLIPGDPDLRTARRIGDQYLRATSDADGAIVLYVEMVGEAMQLSFDYGWDDSAFYDSIARAAYAAQKQARNAVDAATLRALAGHLESLLMHPNFPGWGMDGVIDSLAKTLKERAEKLVKKDEGFA